MKHHQFFNDKSALYESARPVYPPQLYQYLSEVCQSTDQAWDCACGNGQAAESLATLFDKVVATDVSEQQIKNAKVIDGVEFLVSPSEKTAFPDDTFDLVCVAQALHWFDFDAYWPEVKRVLKPDGVFAAWGYTWPSISVEIDAMVQAHILDVIEPYWAPQNKLLWDHYRAIDFPFKRLDAPEFTMAMDWDLNAFFNFIHTFSATRRCMEKEGVSFFEEAFEAIEKVWGDIDQRKKVNLDFTFYAGAMNV